MSALDKWVRLWQSVAIHSAMLAGARPGALMGALGNSMQSAFDRWYEWAAGRRDSIVNGRPGMKEEEYEAVARRFAAVGIRQPG